MKHSRETDELIFLYFRSVHRYFNQDHGKTTTKKSAMHLYIQSVLVPCFNLVVCGIKALSSAFRATVPSGGDWGESGSLRDMFKCIAKLFTCWKTGRFPLSAANIQVNIWWWRSLTYEWKLLGKKCGPRKTRMTRHGWDTSIHIGATIPSQEGRDGLDIHCCCALPTQEKYHEYTTTCWSCSLVMLTTRRPTSHDHNSVIFHDEWCTSNSSTLRRDGLDIHCCCTLPMRGKYHEHITTCCSCSLVMLTTRRLTSHAHNSVIFHGEWCTSNSSTLHLTWFSNLVQIASQCNWHVIKKNVFHAKKWLRNFCMMTWLSNINGIIWRLMFSAISYWNFLY